LSTRVLKRFALCKTEIMPNTQPSDPLHGITLERIVAELVERYGWDRLGRMIAIRCFNQDPSLGSSLKFLRRTPWAREKVEKLYLRRRSGKPGG
jgi:uncharacterized protein (DUF2132 family)